MITCKNIGLNYGPRLGNQMFMIAAVLGIGAENNIEVCFSNWVYSEYFENSLNYKTIEIDKTILEDENDKFELDINTNYNFSGYFQSERYFIKHENIIRHFFTLKDEYNKLVDNFDYNNTCAIHVRRGDYVGGNLHDILCGKENLNNYLKKAIPKIYDNTSNTRFIVFSDDINWCRNNIDLSNCEFVEQQDIIVNMYMMLRCENFIITNSTYSWWAAWLNPNKNKKVVCPYPWLLGSHNDYPLIKKYIYPENWIKINIFE